MCFYFLCTTLQDDSDDETFKDLMDHVRTCTTLKYSISRILETLFPEVRKKCSKDQLIARGRLYPCTSIFEQSRHFSYCRRLQTRDALNCLICYWQTNRPYWIWKMYHPVSLFQLLKMIFEWHINNFVYVCRNNVRLLWYWNLFVVACVERRKGCSHSEKLTYVLCHISIHFIWHFMHQKFCKQINL